ncbi:MAG TPA: TonB-dependent receptor [Terriglobales bacterium]|jgi:outer membrane receptor protein involved in Fe transport|nr:TonB-dependent receptor [Terriglobales bacterium]
MPRTTQKQAVRVFQRLSLLFSSRSITAFVFFFFLSTTSSLRAQIEIGRLAGTVSDPTGARVARADISLDNPLTGRQLRTSSNTQGKFRIENIPYGAYILRVTASGFGASAQDVNVRSNITVQSDINLAVASSGSEVTVRADLVQATSPRTETVIDESFIKLAPTVVRRDQLQALISTTPGWNTENDGLMHIRGVDDGTLFVVDGVPTPDRVDGLFAGSFNTDAITSMDVITGNIPAEFGDKSGAVVVIQPKSGYLNPFNGTLALGGGSFDSRDISTTLGGGTDKWGLFFAGSGHQSDRFLDPVDPRNFNNSGGDVSLDIRADWHPTTNDILRLAGTLQGANFRVPNNEDQQDAGQRQRQELRHDHESLSWQHTVSTNTLFDIAYFRNFFRSNLIPSEFDTPISAQQDRHQTRQGTVASLSHVTHGHIIKAGFEVSNIAISELFRFAVTDPEAAEEAEISDPAMDFTPDNPFLFVGHVSRWAQGVYGQDDFSPFKNLTLSLGVRFDHSDLLISDHQVSPRIGAVYYIPRTRTAIRGSFNRLFMPPQAESLLIASSEQARELSPFADSGGGADIRPEKLSSWEVGFAQELPQSMKLNVAYWWRRFKNIDDPNVLLGTTIIFPNSVAKAEAQGLDVRLDVPIRKGVSAYFTYTNNEIVEIGPLNGGLFLDDDFIEIGPGTRFVPDHDQRNVASFALAYAAERRGLWASFNGRYESGVPLELPDLDDDALHALPGSNLVNFDTGRVKPWYVFGLSGGMDLVRRERFALAAQLDLQNLADRDFAFNWGNPFSGTHFGYPRLISGSLKFTFKK